MRPQVLKLIKILYFSFSAKRPVCFMFQMSDDCCSIYQMDFQKINPPCHSFSSTKTLIKYHLVEPPAQYQDVNEACRALADEPKYP